MKYLLVMVFIGLVSASVSYGDEITNRSCDAIRRCPQGLECYSFPGKGTRCAKQGNPCDYFKCPDNTECVLAMSYPVQIHCSKPASDADIKDGAGIVDGEDPVSTITHMPAGSR